jgi:arylsulfate sulfotransferase
MLSLFAAATGTPEQTTHPLVAKLSSVLPSGVSMFAEFGPDTNYGFKTSTKGASSAPVDLLVAGMQPSKNYHMRLHFIMSDSTEAIGEDEVFTTGDVPAARIPVVTATQSGLAPSPGVELLDLVSGDQQQLRAAVVDLAGNLIWYYDYPVADGIPLPIKPLSNGNMGMSLTRGKQLFRELDLTGQTVREITVDQLNAQLAAAGSKVVLSEIHHDFAELPNGMIVLNTSQIRNFDNLPGFPGTIPVLGDVLVALNPSLKIVWTWSSFDHLDVNRHPWFQLLTGQLPEPVYDWTHTNAVLYSARDKALIVSMRQQSWILKIDFNDGQGSGDILWRLGAGGDFTLVGGADPTDWFYNQHYPSLISNSGPVFDMALFDNGDVRPDSTGTPCFSGVLCYSRPVAMTVDESAKTATLDWDPQMLFSNFGGVVQTLAPGRIEYTFSTVPGAPGGRIVESTMDPIPAEALRLDVGQLCYRGVRLPSLYPGVAW